MRLFNGKICDNPLDRLRFLCYSKDTSEGVYFFVPFFGHIPLSLREAEQISDYREVPL